MPVIKKALVELDGDMFKSYEKVRDKWAVLDCYVSPGPIQFGGNIQTLNFLVKPPNIDELVMETDAHEKYEMSQRQQGSTLFHRDVNALSKLSQARINAHT